MSFARTSEIEPNEADDIRALPAGTVLLGGQYRIESYLSSGGFGITYQARDSLGRQVVIKECFPEALCTRTNKTVRARSSSCTNEFDALVGMFVREARSLAKLSHPNIVGVHQVFEDNETAYMAMDFVDGIDLLRTIEDAKTKVIPAEVVKLTRTLLDAIKSVHEADMLHRDISPDNILIDADGKPVLIDFGAARDEAKQKSRAISALLVVKDGYSPQEFYISGGRQGPSSDLYSLAATIYHLISGNVPPNSQARLAALAGNKPDPYISLRKHAIGYEPNFLRAIDLTMSVFPNDRPQTAQDWLAIIDGTYTGSVTSLSDLQDVLSDLVTEVAQNIDDDVKRESEEETTVVVEVAPTPPPPEAHRWWPLNEPYEPKEPPAEVEVVEEVEAPPIETRRSRKMKRRLGALVLAVAVWLTIDAGQGDMTSAIVAELRLLIGTTIATLA